LWCHIITTYPMHAYIDSPDWESVIEVVQHSDAQKHLNQWRHSYYVRIIHCAPVLESTGFHKTYLSILRKPRVA